MNDIAHLLEELASAVRFNIQFNDQHALHVLKRDSASAVRLAQAILEREDKVNSRRVPNPNTWDRTLLSGMYFRPRVRDNA